MSIWHEVQIEFASDAGNDLIEKHGETPELKQIMEVIGDAWKLATDLPEDNKEESIQLLTRSNVLLTQAEDMVPANYAKEYRIFRNKIKNAKIANSTTIEEIRVEQ